MCSTHEDQITKLFTLNRNQKLIASLNISPLKLNHTPQRNIASSNNDTQRVIQTFTKNPWRKVQGNDALLHVLYSFPITPIFYYYGNITNRVKCKRRPLICILFQKTFNWHRPPATDRNIYMSHVSLLNVRSSISSLAYEDILLLLQVYPWEIAEPGYFHVFLCLCLFLTDQF